MKKGFIFLFCILFVSSVFSEKLVNVGKYKIWSSETQLFENLRVALNGAEVVHHELLGSHNCHVIKTLSPYVLKSRAERFIEVVYDCDKDGEVTYFEIIRGNDKFKQYLDNQIISSIPGDGNSYLFILINQSSLLEFEINYLSFHSSKKNRQLHLFRLAFIINKLKKLNHNSLNVSDGNKKINVWISDKNPNKLSVFSITLKSGKSYIDGVNPAYFANLDGKLDQIFTGNHFMLGKNLFSETNIDPNIYEQNTFEYLVDLVYINLI